MRQKKNVGRDSFNSPMLIVTLIASVVFGIVALLISGILTNALPRCVRVAIVLTLFLLMMGLTVFIASMIMGTFYGDVISGKRHGGRVPLYFLAMLLVSFVVGMGLEKIYELYVPSQSYNPDTYIFLVDESGSMSASDDSNQRYSAIRPMLESKQDDIHYMVYTFANETNIELGLTDDLAQLDSLVPQCDGGTYLGNGLDTILSDYANGVWSTEKGAAVIVITDGYAHDLGYFSAKKMVKRYNEANIMISTVGLTGADSSLLSSLAEGTGGKFVYINDSQEMQNALVQASESKDTNRNLLNRRSERNYSLLLGVMRVVFLTILGFLVGALCAIAYGNSYCVTEILITSGFKSLLAGLLMEIGNNVIRFPSPLIFLLSCILVGMLLCRYGLRKSKDLSMHNIGAGRTTASFGMHIESPGHTNHIPSGNSFQKGRKTNVTTPRKFDNSKGPF